MIRTTKILFSLTAMLALIIGSVVAEAQSRYTDAGATNKVSIGVTAQPGISVPVGGLDSLDEAGLGFAFRGGLDIVYPVSIDVSLLLGVGIDMRSLGVREDSLLDPRSGSVQYLYFEPGISYASIALSLNVGLPMSGTQPTPRGPNFNGDFDATEDVPSENLEMLLEPRLSGTLVLMDEKAYWFGIKIGVGLPLNDLYKADSQRDPDDDSSGYTLIGSTSPLTAHLGATFQFGLFDAF